MFFVSNIKSECTACGACVNSCPRNCIDFKLDDEGFFYPQIDHDTCINCLLCQKVCPVEHPVYDNFDKPKVYASLLNDKNEIIKSSSGGIFYAIASWVISNGGVVFGATLDENNQVRHIAVEEQDNLYKLRGSKYVQSDLGQIFKQIRNTLNDNRWCYFVGTGCQVAGLKAFLKKDFEKLILSDVVCHGVPSQSLFNTHIDYLSKKFNGDIRNYQFRDNAKWGGCESFDVYKNGIKIKTIVTPTYELSPFLYSFMHSMTFRYSCYDCKFAKVPRQGDVTLADYWGVKKIFPAIDSSHGVSLVLINSIKGESIWNSVKGTCMVFESNLPDGCRYNGNLTSFSEMPNIRKTVFGLLKSKGYSKMADKEFKSPQYCKLKIASSLQNSKILSALFSTYISIKVFIKSFFQFYS